MVLAATFLTTFVAACGGTAAPPAKSPALGVSSEEIPQDLGNSTPQQAKAAYVGMWREMAKAARTSNWRDPDLARYATGNALTTITRSLYADHFNHLVTRGVPKDSPEAVSAEPRDGPKTVMLSDCGDDSGAFKAHEGTNEPVNDEPGGHRSITAEVEKQADGTWRVSRFAVMGVGSC
jgi:hypothetical protein